MFERVYALTIYNMKFLLKASTPLFDAKLLKNLNWSSVKNYLNPPITNEETGESWLVVRPLEIQDYNKGYLELLTQLTAVGNVSKEKFEGKQS